MKKSEISKPLPNGSKSHKLSSEQRPGIQTQGAAPAWLEEVNGQEALDWVRTNNAEAFATLDTPRFRTIRKDIQEVLENPDKIPFVRQRGNYLYNFWTDATHERGLWRRTTWDSYLSDNTRWETLLDLDKLAEDEGVSWVWHGASLLYPDYQLALITLSDGGSDADTTREFDMRTLNFVDSSSGAFIRPTGKGSCSWVNADTLLVSTDMGAGTTTESGYPAQVRLWQRGTSLDHSPVIFSCEYADLMAGAHYNHTPGFEHAAFSVAHDFYSSKTYLHSPQGSPNHTNTAFEKPFDITQLQTPELIHIDVPDTASPALHRQWLIVRLRDPWTTAGQDYPAGALLGIDINAFLAGDRRFEVLYRPDPHSSLEAATWTRNHLILTIQRNVVSTLTVCTPPNSSDTSSGPSTEWTHTPVNVTGLPALGNISVAAIDPIEDDRVWLTTSGFTTPVTLQMGRIDARGKLCDLRVVKQAPTLFDATDVEVSQHWAVSDDATLIPYFQVGKPRETSGPNTAPPPVLLTGYGGFEISMTPGYSPGMGRAWLEGGGIYVLACIRGGGEFGPEWHKVAIGKGRHLAYEDFHAVAHDLVKRGVSTPEKIIAEGGSNGGLLVGNMLTRYPDSFGGIVCQVPLLDMLRYHQFLAGASWIAEYGDPENEADLEHLRSISPVHNFDAARTYPPVLFTTSTKDDRVHPVHARTMMWLMRQAHKDVLSYENIEGGHGGAATVRQRAELAALAYEFAWQKATGS
ncbi:MAG: prolyl oligopeptidase family serine peptidase [Actinomycetaceae bacterium]|nr:prolyl oligopeptidase family serine peptidase [Actinomycetaceae bacterium]